MGEYYNRYAKFTVDSQVMPKIPFIPIPESSTDLYVVYDKDTMRMDTLSYKYYGDPNYGWLILQANPRYGGFEFSIENGVTLRIPYPLNDAISGYESGVGEWLNKHELK